MILLKTYFHLRDENALKKTAILCLVSFKKMRIKLSTGLSIEPKDWHKKKQCSNSDSKLNKKINAIKERFSEYEKECELKDKEIHIDDARVLIIDPDENEQVKKVKNKRLFSNYIQRYYDLYIKVKAWNTIKKYTTLKNLFEEQYPTVTIDEVNSNFANKVRAEWLNQKKKDNTISKRFQLIRTVLKWAEDLGEIKNVSYKYLTHEQTEKIEAIALDWEEIKKIKNLDLKDKPALSNIRDQFIVSIYTGVDFVDLPQLNKLNIKKSEKGHKYFHIVRRKTEKKEIISYPPCTKEVEEIFKRHKWDFKFISYDKSLKHIKEICRLAEINEKITLHSHSGNQLLTETKEKYNWVSWKTARRSFITNKLYDGSPTEAVASAVGHTKLSTTAKYQHTKPGKMVDMLFENKSSKNES